MFSKPNLKRIALSAVKAFAAASIAYVIANEADIAANISNMSLLKGVAFAALVAGLDAAAKAIQVALEG